MATRNVTHFSNSSGTDVIDSGPIVDEIDENLKSIHIYPFIFVIMCMVIGLIGNLIVIYIFTRKWKLTKTTVFILTLAGVDLMSCVVNMPTEAAILWNPRTFDYDVICKISRFTTFIASASSSFVLIAISIDRYLMVCRPFLGRELGVRYARKTCLIAVMLGIVTTWPSLIFYGTYTYHINRIDAESGSAVQIEVKTCLISNFYVENYKLPAGFYFFLFGAHVIMFVILTLVYLLIGRKLFISTSTDVSNEKRHSLKYFGISMMSALTGTVPNSPADNRDRVSWSSKGSRAVSLENINRIEQSPGTRRSSQARLSNETNVSIILNDIEKCHNSAKDELNKCINNKNENTECKSLPVCSKQCCEPTLGDTGKKPASTPDTLTLQPSVTSQPSLASDDSASDTSFHSNDKLNKNNARKLLGLKILQKDKNVDRNGRLSSGSTASTCYLTQNSPMTPVTPAMSSPISPDSVRGILYRSQSVESRSRLNRIISDELRRVEVKEFSLRRNTLMMRMVTIAFVVSFLPYLVIVTIRYSDPDVPTKIGKIQQIFYHLFLRTYFINSMINPFIYGFMNMEFRAKIRELFCKFCTKTTAE